MLDASGLLVLPGLINAHQHLYQVGLRSIPRSWSEPPSDLGWQVSAAVHAVVERRTLHPRGDRRGGPSRHGGSLLCGVTTVADQHYFFPGGVTAPYIEATIEAATEVGIRLHAGRGTMTMGHSDGGMAPTRRARRSTKWCATPWS